MGRGRAKESKVISTRQIKNYERACAPVRVEAGFDECAGTVHSSRFLRGFIGDPQELWLQARTHMEIEGLSPITNYEMGGQGIGDLLTTPVWEEIHNPGSRLLCLQMLSPKSVETALRNPDKSESPKLFDTIGELKTAVITLDTAILRVMPWNHAFRTLALYLVSTNYGDSELGGKTSKVQVLTGFVNEVMLQNAKAWVEKRKYFSHQDLVNKWPAFMNRSSSVLKTAEPSRGSQKKQKHTKTGSASGGGGWFPTNRPQMGVQKVQPRGLQGNWGQARCLLGSQFLPQACVLKDPGRWQVLPEGTCHQRPQVRPPKGGARNLTYLG